MFKIKRLVEIDLNTNKGILHWQWLFLKGKKQYNNFKVEHRELTFNKPLPKGTQIQAIYSTRI